MVRIWDFLREHGYALMLAGMVLVAAGSVMLVQTRQTGVVLRVPAFIVAGIGIVIYVAGRVGVSLRGRRRRKPNEGGDGGPDSL